MITVPYEMKLVTGVYIIRNMENGKEYVGSASVGMYNRWHSHLCYLRQGIHHSQHLQHAWNKYGEDSFRFMVIEECSPEECVDKEQWWLDELETFNPDKGYNISPTAGSPLGVIRNKETRAKISVERETVPRNIKRRSLPLSTQKKSRTRSVKPI